MQGMNISAAGTGEQSDVEDEIELYEEFDVGCDDGDEIDDEVDDMSYGMQSDGDPSEAQMSESTTLENFMINQQLQNNQTNEGANNNGSGGGRRMNSNTHGQHVQG